MNKFGSLVLSAALTALPVSGAWAYQGGDVKDGGSISGTVKFSIDPCLRSFPFNLQANCTKRHSTVFQNRRSPC